VRAVGGAWSVDLPTRGRQQRPTLPIDAAELQAHIDELGEIGKHPEAGLYRALYSDSWVEAMALVERWLLEAGLEPRRDAVGNLFGRLAGSASSRVVLTG